MVRPLVAAEVEGLADELTGDAVPAQRPGGFVPGGHFPGRPGRGLRHRATGRWPRLPVGRCRRGRVQLAVQVSVGAVLVPVRVPWKPKEALPPAATEPL